MLAILTTHPVQYQVPLWQALAKEGSVPFEVWFLSRHGIEPSPDVEFQESFKWDIDLLSGYPYEFLRTNSNPRVHRFWGVRLRENLRKRFRDKKVKVLWIQGWQVFAYWQVVRQAHEAGVEVWVRGESNGLAPVPFWKRLPKKILLRALFGKINHFLYIGRANRRFYETYGVPSEKLHFAPYCVDNERFMRQAKELLPNREKIRREWKIPDKAFCILFAGKFIPKKRPLDLVRAVSNGRLNRSSRPLHLLFAGSGELGPKLRRQCNVVFDKDVIARSAYGSLAMTSQVPSAVLRPPASFVGFLNQTEISKAYVAADCLVLPSDSHETWGLVVNEALASGLPCITSDACGCGEDLIERPHPKLLFQTGNQKALWDALLFLMSHPFPHHALQEQVSKFGFAITVKTVRDLYRSYLTSVPTLVE